jgi:hypothetical protein
MVHPPKQAVAFLGGRMSHLQWQDVSCLRPCDTQISGRISDTKGQDVAFLDAL